MPSINSTEAANAIREIQNRVSAMLGEAFTVGSVLSSAGGSIAHWSRERPTASNMVHLLVASRTPLEMLASRTGIEGLLVVSDALVVDQRNQLFVCQMHGYAHS